ncbi:DUF4974 domain-containing protein [Bacteroides sp. 519]|nr:DUF4974 domain-containing protein [Bacteroides sp. 519]
MQTIIQHYIEGNATANERRQFLLWLKEDEEHTKEYRALRKLHDLNTWNMNKASTTAPEVETKPKKKRLYTLAREALKLSAVLLIGILSTWFIIENKDKVESAQMQTIYVPSGQRAEVLLCDGTKVWVNSQTTLTFPDKFVGRQRVVTLDGEGYFEVAKDTDHPFIVETGLYNISVLGTEFNVKAYQKKDIFETALIEGSVEILSDNTTPVRLVPNETVVLANGKLVRGTITDHNYFKWREGLICFEKEKLSSLFEKLELYYDVKIIVENKALLQWPYNGKFRVKDGVEHALRVLQHKHKFEYIKDEEDNTIIIR